jgi:hypothetical protein
MGRCFSKIKLSKGKKKRRTEMEVMNNPERQASSRTGQERETLASAAEKRIKELELRGVPRNGTNEINEHLTSSGRKIKASQKQISQEDLIRMVSFLTIDA